MKFEWSSDDANSTYSIEVIDAGLIQITKTKFNQSFWRIMKKIEIEQLIDSLTYTDVPND